MMILWLILMPAVAGVLAFVLRNDTLRRLMLLVVAGGHAAMTAWLWTKPEATLTMFSDWLMLGDLERLFLSITSLLFLAAAFYAVGYLRKQGRGQRAIQEGMLFDNAGEANFTCCLLLFLSTMTLVIVSQHLGILWVAVEATTLVSAPLIYFHRHNRSLEATWKYLLICSVGIALALMGNFMLAAAVGKTTHPVEMTVQGLQAAGAMLDPTFLKAAFLLLLVGYGTKMGLAPLHTWLPDAHSEAPSVVSALLSGALLNCAFLAILRVHAVLAKAGLAAFGQELLVVFGLVSMGFAAVFIIRQADYKRMLAYSSVEHMGILALGVGLGGLASAGCLLHAVNHSLTKAMLFMLAGNVLAAYQTKSTADVRGLLRRVPLSGMLWVAGFLAITGSPPFGPFMSELKILMGGFQTNIPAAVAAFAMLAVIFVAMAAICLRMAYGKPAGELAEPFKESKLMVWPPALLCGCVLVLGMYVPPQLTETIRRAIATLGVP